MTQGPRTIAVLGGGIAGLSAAWELTRSAPRGTKVVLLESDRRVGGKIRTMDMWGRAIDLGPDAFVARRLEARSLCQELGLGEMLVTPATSSAFVWSRGKLRPLPRGLALGVPTRMVPLWQSGICSPSGVLRAGLDLLDVRDLLPRGRRPRSAGHDEHYGRAEQVRGPDDAVGPIVRRRLGREVQERLVDPLVGGINVGATDAMSAAMVFPQLLEASRSKGSLIRALRRITSPASPTSRALSIPAPSPVFMGLRGGLERLPETLLAGLVERGCEVRMSTHVDKLSGPTGDGRWSIVSGSECVEADGVVLAVPSPVASRLMGSTDPALERLLAEIPYASVTLVTHRFSVDATSRSFDGSGFLVPVAEGRLMTACTWLSSKWPQLARTGEFLVRVSMGRYGDDRHDHLSDDEAIRSSVAELEAIMGVRGAPVESFVTRWPRAFPQYFVGHAERVSMIEQRARGIGALVMAGAGLHGVGIPSCIASGRRAAKDLISLLERQEAPGPVK